MSKKIKDKDLFDVTSFVKKVTQGPSKRKGQKSMTVTQLKFPWYNGRSNNKRS